MKILVVEDEPKVARLIERCLVEEGHHVSLLANGSEAIERLAALAPEAAVLDVMLPGADGFAVCRAIRERLPGTGVIMLSAKGAVDDRITGLAAGADDYMAKPFAVAELLLRVQALERRIAPKRPGRWQLDPLRHELTVGEKRVALTPREAALMDVFLRHEGETLSRARLAEEGWQVAFETGTNQVDVYVGYLRRKLDNIGLGHAIETERGAGYRFWVPPDATVRL